MSWLVLFWLFVLFLLAGCGTGNIKSSQETINETKVEANQETNLDIDADIEVEAKAEKVVIENNQQQISHSKSVNKTNNKTVNNSVNKTSQDKGSTVKSEGNTDIDKVVTNNYGGMSPWSLFAALMAIGILILLIGIVIPQPKFIRMLF